MKGLFLADLYSVRQTAWPIVLVDGAFILTATVANTGRLSWAMSYCAMALAGMLAVSIQEMDERSHWNTYAQTLPCTRRQQVAVKYVISLAYVLIVWLLFMAAFAFQAARGNMKWAVLPGVAAAFLALGMIPMCILFPVMYRFGPVKARIAYTTGSVFIGSMLTSATMQGAARLRRAAAQPRCFSSPPRCCL